MSIPGWQIVYACSCEGCDSKGYVRHDQVAGRWTIKQIGLCDHGPNSSYLEGKSLHLPLRMTLKLKDLLQGHCPQRALALMREAFPGDPVVEKKWIAHWNAWRAPSPPPNDKAELEKWINKRRGLHKMGKGSVQAAIASEGYLSDVEVKLHNMHVHDQILITKNDEHVEEISMKQ